VKKIKSIVIAMLLITMMFNVFPIVFPAVSAHPDWKEELDWLAADVNYDGKVNMKDIYFIILWFGEYCPDADVNCDTKVNMKDIYEAILHFGKYTNEITIVDSAGRTVTIPYPLKNMCITNPPSAEIVRALEYTPGDRRNLVIGVSGTIKNRPDYWPILSQATQICDYAHSKDLYYEVVIALNPSAVFVYGTHRAVDIDHIQENLPGIPVVGIDCYKYDTLYNDIELWGIILGRRCKVAEIRNLFENILGMVAERTADIPEEDKVRIYAEHHARNWLAAAKFSEWTKMIEMAGAKNIFGHIPGGYTEVDCEAVYYADPQVILKDTRLGLGWPMGYNKTDEEVINNMLSAWNAEHKEDCGEIPWDDVSAVKNGKIYAISQDLASGPEKIYLVLYIAKICYPERFTDIDPDEYLRDWIRDYQHVPCDAIPDPCGIFIYPHV